MVHQSLEAWYQPHRWLRHESAPGPPQCVPFPFSHNLSLTGRTVWNARSARGLSLQAYTLETLGRYREAIEIIRLYEAEENLEGLGLETEIKVITQLAICYNNLSDYPKAVTLLKENLQRAKDADLVHLLAYQEHFRQTYNLSLRFPEIFGVRIGRDAVFPAEVCVVERGQLYRKKIPAEIGPEFLKFSTQQPHDKLNTIEAAVSGPVSASVHKKRSCIVKMETSASFSTTTFLTSCGRLA